MGDHTNNTTEGIGIHAGPGACVKMGLYNVDHMSDSNIRCNILNDKSARAQCRLHEISKSIKRAKQICREACVCVCVGGVYYTHVTRNRNTVADAEANATMDTCQPMPEVWNTECDSSAYPTAELTRAWKPRQPYPTPMWPGQPPHRALTGPRPECSEGITPR